MERLLYGSFNILRSLWLTWNQGQKSMMEECTCQAVEQGRLVQGLRPAALRLPPGKQRPHLCAASEMTLKGAAAPVF